MIRFAWHVHHDRLLEPLFEPIHVRIAWIQHYKPLSEHALRLRLLKPVRGKLPKLLVQVGAKVEAAYTKALGAAAKAAGKARAPSEAADKAWMVADKARATAVEAWAAYDKALATCRAAIRKLHEQECPQCPWADAK